MGSLVRFGVSLDCDLLTPFDALCGRKGYTNRSEAIRDLIRKALVTDSFERTLDYSTGTLTLLYDHHRNDLSKKMTQIQHEDFDIIITTVHVHLDHETCLEVLVLKGDAERVRKLSDKLISCTGVKYGVFCGTEGGAKHDDEPTGTPQRPDGRKR
ncbi:MAG: nickel-responsive transcriptional regulator NikR [Desulfovibrionaceae bacterium]|nr:nickel-responsive transcriptional regulator NikR [Desulfovibrionaceae bacterium]